MNTTIDVELPPPVSSPSGNHKIWSILCHVSSFLGVGFVLPLIVYLSMKGDSAYVRENSREALNFHLSLLLYALCCIPLVFVVVGIPLLILISLASLVLSIVAAVKASDGGCYRYPLTIRFIR